MRQSAICERCGDIAELTERELCGECDELDRPMRERQAKLERQWMRIHKAVFGVSAILALMPGLGFLLAFLGVFGLAYVNAAFLLFERRWVGWKHVRQGLLAPIGLFVLVYAEAMIVLSIVRAFF